MKDERDGLSPLDKLKLPWGFNNWWEKAIISFFFFGFWILIIILAKGGNC
jgi:hypothetical protein